MLVVVGTAGVGSDGLKLVDIEGILMLGSESEPIVGVVGGAVMFTYWNPELYPVTDGQPVGDGYPTVSNLPALIVGSMMDPIGATVQRTIQTNRVEDIYLATSNAWYATK